MIAENQKILNRLNGLSDALLIYVTLLLAYFLRFYVLPGGVDSIGFRSYARMGVVVTLVQMFLFAASGLYQSFRKVRLRVELEILLRDAVLVMFLLLSWLFIGHGSQYSRWVLALYFLLDFGTLALKRIVLRKTLRKLRGKGKNLKNILVVGSGETAKRYLREIRREHEMGYRAVGYISGTTGKGFEIPYLGGYEALEKVLERYNPEEVIAAIEMDEYRLTPHVIEACENTGIKLSIIPFYSEYMPSHPQFDNLNGIPMLNIRRIPLDNFANAFFKRATDIVGSLLLIVLTSPLMLLCAVGVRVSSPGPILFRQERVGRNKKTFYMLKFRSMRVNSEQDTAWSTKTDSRRTRFGSFIRKYSLDELPQFFNVLKGDMSLVGPRPEIPHFVEQFREEIPLYMIRHQVRPGITGWAQVNDLRGDTSIKKRIEYDIFYIENWTMGFDIQILLATVFRGKFINDEQ